MSSKRPMRDGLPVQCGDCPKVYEFNLTEKPLPDGGIRAFTKCPHCKVEHEIIRLTRRGVELRSRMEKLREKPDKTPDDYQRLESLQRDFQREIDPRPEEVLS